MRALKFTVRYSTLDPHLITERLCRNPNYGGKPCTVPGSCVIPVIERAMKPKFFEALCKSVALEGFRNPILVYHTPEGTLLSFGGSRLRTAKRLDVGIPAIVVDYVGDFADCEEVTPDNWQDFFRDVPVYFEFTDIGVDTHYSLERARREWYDPAGMEWADPDAEFIREEFEWLK